MDKSFEQQLHLNSDVTNFTSEEFLHLNSCGISRYTYQDKSLAIRYFRPKGRLDFHLLYLTSGRAEVVVGDKTLSVSAGDCVFYPPNIPQDYTYFISEDSPVNSSFYVHFCGTAAEEITEKAGFKEAVLLHRESEEVKRLFTAMITANASGDRLSACGQLLRLLPLLSPALSESGAVGVGRIKKAVEYINAHFTEEIDLVLCAEKCSLSRSRFSHLFTETMGMSPHKYQQKLRLDMAKELLVNSTLSVGEISAGVGFADPLYFSRTFSRQNGISPSDYRKLQV